MIKKMQTILFTLLLACFLGFVVLQLRCSVESSREQLNRRARQNHFIQSGKKSILASTVQAIGLDYEPDKEVKTRLLKKDVKFVLMILHKLNSVLKVEGVSRLSVVDQQAILNLTKFLDTHADYDGATAATQKPTERLERNREFFKQSSCSFIIKNWTMVIKNSGRLHRDTRKDAEAGWYQECNIAEGPFLVRKERFLSLRWRPDCGSMSHLDFFVRSNASLKIAKLLSCSFSPEIMYTDRGILEGTRDFIDYSTLGQLHSILRIVRPDKIEWTKCLDDKQFCPEAPLSTRSNTMAASSGFPICCDVVMDDIFAASVDAMNKLGIEYRVVYGTLLGAVRSRAFIPYSDDVDAAIHKADNDNYSKFRVMQHILGPRYFVAWKMNPPTTRVYPHFAPMVLTDTARLFKTEESLESEALFNSKILTEMKKLLPVQNILLEQRYVDLYPSPESWFRKSTQVTINNRNYLGVSVDVDKMLRGWYGDDYMEKRPEIHSRTTLQTE